MRKILLVTFTVVVLFFSLILFKFGSALTQEGNPIPILTSIMKLELPNHGFQKVSESDYDEKYVSEYNGENPYGIVKEYMIDLGWAFKEQMGSGLIFMNNEEVITIETRQYSRNYFLWKVPKEALN